MQFFSMIGGRFIDPLLYEYPPSLFRILSNSLSPPPSSYCLISLAECVIIPQPMLFSFALWFNIRHRTDQHTGYSDRCKTQWPIDWQTRIETYQHHLLFCTQTLPELHWVNHFVDTKTHFTEVQSVFAFRRLLLVEVIYLQIRFKKTKSFLWNTNEMVLLVKWCKWAKHTHTQHAQKYNFKKV